MASGQVLRPPWRKDRGRVPRKGRGLHEGSLRTDKYPTRTSRRREVQHRHQSPTRCRCLAVVAKDAATVRPPGASAGAPAPRRDAPASRTAPQASAASDDFGGRRHSVLNPCLKTPVRHAPGFRDHRPSPETCMTTWLVTGAGGFIGGNFVPDAVRARHAWSTSTH